jgi:hypothetical protein
VSHPSRCSLCAPHLSMRCDRSSRTRIGRGSERLEAASTRGRAGRSASVSSGACPAPPIRALREWRVLGFSPVATSPLPASCLIPSATNRGAWGWPSPVECPLRSSRSARRRTRRMALRRSTEWSSDLLRSGSRYCSCPTRRMKTRIPRTRQTERLPKLRPGVSRRSISSRRARVRRRSRRSHLRHTDSAATVRAVCR